MHIRCYICGKIIIGSYYKDWANHVVCAHHGSSIVHCVSCGQFCNSKSLDIGNGAKLCSYCQEHYMTKKDCSHVVGFIRRLYSNSVIGDVSNWHLKVIDAVALQKRTGNLNAKGLAVRYGDDYTVYVLRQLSKVQFAKVLAHELLHIWQYNRNLNPIPMLCEGFCNLGSYVVLTNINNAESKAAQQNLLTSEDPIYGEGFRRCLQLYQEGGWPNVINELKHNQE